MRWLGLLAFAACWSSSSPASVEPRPGPPRIQTCAIDPPIRVPQRLQITRWLGRIGDRSWIIGKHGQQLQLVGLDGQRLSATEIPLDVLRAEYVAGTHLWLAGTRDQRNLLVELDLDSPTPRAGEPIDLQDITPLSNIDGIALGGDRMLLAERGAKISLQLFDRARLPHGTARDRRFLWRARHKIGVETQINSSELLVPELRCNGDRCFAIGIEGEGVMRRLYVERFAPDGKAEHEIMSDDRVWTYHLAATGDRTVVMWTSMDVPGLFMRVVDASGRPLTRRAAIKGVAPTPITVEVLPAAPPRIAIKDSRGEWSVGTLDIGANRLDEVRSLPLPNQTSSFTGVVIPDGILGAGFTNAIEYGTGAHTWSSEATATFLPSTRDAEPPIAVLPKTIGDGRGGMAAFPLVAPGHAAVLVVPQGFELPDGGELFVVRRPCK